MPQVELFSLASLNARWLSVRHALVAENIANANTPKYRAKDVAPFETVMQSTALAMARTNPLHLTNAGTDDMGVEIVSGTGWETTHSGNNVSLEAELLKAGENRRQFALDAGIVKTFHRLFLAGLKG
jgi:flagellar basal-body rod protein FlgB